MMARKLPSALVGSRPIVIHALSANTMVQVAGDKAAILRRIVDIGMDFLIAVLHTVMS